MTWKSNPGTSDRLPVVTLARRPSSTFDGREGAAISGRKSRLFNRLRRHMWTAPFGKRFLTF